LILGLDINQIIMTIVVVCLILWRISYGGNNGLFAEAAGLIAVIASFVAVYYLINVAMKLVNVQLGEIIPKIGYLIVAFAVYKIMTALAEGLRKITNIPIIGKVDRFLGAVLGMVEAILIIKLVEYITGIVILNTALSVCGVLIEYIKKSFINK
jgi:membrane protein required for colicin V production